MCTSIQKPNRGYIYIKTHINKFYIVLVCQLKVVVYLCSPITKIKTLESELTHMSNQNYAFLVSFGADIRRKTRLQNLRAQNFDIIKYVAAEI